MHMIAHPLCEEQRQAHFKGHTISSPSHPTVQDQALVCFTGTNSRREEDVGRKRVQRIPILHCRSISSRHMTFSYKNCQNKCFLHSPRQNKGDGVGDKQRGIEEKAKLSPKWGYMRLNDNKERKKKNETILKSSDRALQYRNRLKKRSLFVHDINFLSYTILIHPRPSIITSTPSTTWWAQYSSLLWTEADHRLPHCGHIQPWRHA